MSALAWIAGTLALLAAICAMPWLCQCAFRSLLHDWRNAPGGGSAFNPLQEMVQPQIRHVMEVHEQRLKEDAEGGPPVPTHQRTKSNV